MLTLQKSLPEDNNAFIVDAIDVDVVISADDFLDA